MKKKRWKVPTKLERKCFRCPECSASHAIVDEDGCCAVCGVDTIVTGCLCTKARRRLMESKVR